MLSKDNRCPTSKVANTLEDYRLKRNLNKAQMARLLGWTASAYSNLLRRKDSSSEVQGNTIEKIAKALEIPVESILNMETFKERQERILSTLPDFIIEWLGTANGRAAVFQLYKAHYEALQEHEKELMLNKLRANPNEAPDVWENSYADTNPKLEYTVEIHSAPPPWPLIFFRN